MIKVFRIIKDILFWLTVAAMLLGLVIFGVLPLFGVQYRAVLTGSMEPEIPVGSLVMIVKTDAEEIQVGDDVTYVSSGRNVTTHRVAEIDRENNSFITYGIANGLDNKDPAVRYENILGVVRLHIPGVGPLFTALTTTSGKIIAITVIVAVFLISLLIGTNLPEKDDKTQPKTGLPDEEENESRKAMGIDTGKKQAEKPPKPAKPPKAAKVRPETTDDFWNGGRA